MATTAEQWLSEIFESEEYRTGLRARIVSGTCKPQELALALRLGLSPTIEAEERADREAIKRMPAHERATLMRLLRRVRGLDTTPTTPILHPVARVAVGLVFTSLSEIPVPVDQTPTTEPTTETDDLDLRPPKATR